MTPAPGDEQECLQSLLGTRARDGGIWIVRPECPLQSDRATRTTYGELFEAATVCAGALSARGAPGAPVVVMLENGTPFITAFFGVLFAGMIPVPFAPSSFVAGKSSDHMERLGRVVRDCDPALIIGDDTWRAKSLAVEGLRVTPVSELMQDPAGRVEPWPASASDTALIQYTSGSTGAPRGVELSHRSLLANVRNIGRAVRVGPGDVGVSWLPLFHDMGLIGSLLFCLACEIPLVLMTPREFLKQPASWLWAISRFRGTLSPAPNFAFHACVSRVDEQTAKGLDLGSWRVAFNGAEAIHLRTVEEFTARFRSAGLGQDVVRPVYGLAENALAATLPTGGALRVDRVRRGALERDNLAVPALEHEEGARAIVGVGRSPAGQRIRIANEACIATRERVVGEIQIAGPCVMKGYYRKAAETARTMTPDGWLRTGDRGYIADGELFVTGRDKDVIKKRGACLDAEDVERAAFMVAGVRDGRIAAFGGGVDEMGSERLVIAVEVDTRQLGRLDTLRGELAGSILRHCEARPDEIVFVRAGTLPRTSSGKVRRGEARRRYSDGALKLAGDGMPARPVQQ